AVVLGGLDVSSFPRAVPAPTSRPSDPTIQPIVFTRMASLSSIHESGSDMWEEGSETMIARNPDVRDDSSGMRTRACARCPRVLRGPQRTAGAARLPDG